jgi:hypothetical protein
LVCGVCGRRSSRRAKLDSVIPGLGQLEERAARFSCFSEVATGFWNLATKEIEGTAV